MPEWAIAVLAWSSGACVALSSLMLYATGRGGFGVYCFLGLVGTVYAAILVRGRR